MFPYKKIFKGGSNIEAQFFEIPNSPATSACLEILSAGQKLPELSARKRDISRGAMTCTVQQNGQTRRINYNSKDKFTIELNDINLLYGNNKTAKKLFLFVVSKIKTENLSETGTLSQKYISFPVHELVDIGMYSQPQNARRGFKEATEILTSFKISGFTNKTESLEVLFTGSKITKGRCFIYLNERINWGLLTKYLTLLPKYFFALSNKGTDLTYYIFHLARQRLKEIQENGYFTIKLQTLSHRLMLPTPTKCKNPNRDIKKPIEAAIAEINNYEKQNKTESLTLKLMTKPEQDVLDFLKTGLLCVYLQGDYAERLNRFKRKLPSSTQ